MYFTGRLIPTLPALCICMFVYAAEMTLCSAQQPYGPEPCTLNLYKGTNVFVGKEPGCYDNQNACVDVAFLFGMNLLNQWATECGVKVYVCRSFVPTMADGSSHNPKNVINNEVGHGVDIRLKNDDNGAVHSDWAIDDSGTDCFMKKLDAEKTLYWEMSFDGGLTGEVHGTGEAIHIDDRKYQKNRTYWKFLHSRLYKYCRFL